MFLKNFFKKKKKVYIPKNAYDAPLKYRFTFVAEGWSYYEGYVVQISENINTKEKAFFIASELFLKQCADRNIKSVAVFFGEVGTPDCKDVLFGRYKSLVNSSSE